MTHRRLSGRVAVTWRYVALKRNEETKENKSKKIFLKHRERQLQPSVVRRLRLGTMTGLITAPSHGYARISQPVYRF